MSGTGATPAQIEAAVERTHAVRVFAARKPHLVEQVRDEARANIALIAPLLVPIDHRIAGPDQIEALRRALGAAAAGDHMRQADFDTLFPLIEADR